ncbi:MAG: 4Fe-4S binding protein [Clostridia bacterium]|nr:4Fe-4S binding protein [Clostridia bacterium]MBQ4618825.1 4Fe-4S binding protein [Clostridia bacterium]MBQ9857285.1 4Fe-4S binding protein [Clostridia bacterium]
MDCLTLKKSNCKNCYKCIRHCPVKAIRFSGNQAHIIGNECILCGQCFVVCPQDAKRIVNEVEKVKVLIQTGIPVYVSLAPSFIANYDGVGIESMREALKKLGFKDVEETAIGATYVKNEYERMLKEEERDVVISSCCHSINLLIQKQFPSLLGYLADVVSPMQAHCADIKRRVPNAKCVFIGPCVAKKDEADHYKGVVDAVLTFEELTNWLKEENITLKQQVVSDDQSRARFFPTTGGILKTMKTNAPGYTYMALDGVENCIAALKDIENGHIHKCFIEMSACVGSCIGGPVMEKYHKHSIIKDYISVSDYAGKEDFDVVQPKSENMRKHFSYIERENKQPSETEIYNVLRQMGKFKPSDELNCGSCGYNTCRDKAIAIIQGKAEISMCLPFLKDKAESFSDTIVKNTPNGLIVLNEMLEVQQINKAMLHIMNLRNANDVLGEPVVRILEPSVFMSVLHTGREVHEQRTYLAQYKRYVEQSIIYDRESRMLIGIMRDITEEESSREKRESISRQTVEVADKVVEKQMRIVQEIASLLGETAAETKIALTKLKESIKNE